MSGPFLWARFVQITRHGYYTVKGPDGEFLRREDGRTLRVTSRDECYEWITEDGRAGLFRIECPDRSVRVIGSVADPGSGDTTAPTVPTGVQATAVNKNRVDVSWNASTDDVGVAGYQVFRDGSPLDTVNHPTTSYTDNTVQPSTQYGYSIAAYDGSGNTSSQSGSESVTTPANSAPTWDSVPDQDLIVGNSLSLNLGDYADDSDTDPLTYTVESGTLPTGVTLSGSTISGTPTTAGESSAVTIRADDGNDTSDAVINFATYDADVTAPPVPTGVEVTSFTANTVTVGCDASVDAAGSADEYVSGTVSYRFYRDSAPIATQSSRVYQHTGLSDETSYSFTVSAIDANGNESAESSAVVQVTAAAGAEVFDYRRWGVPYLTDTLPSGLMPTLPTPDSQAGWPYDPLTRVAPTPEEHWPDPDVAVTGSYYIDNTHPSSTDSGNPYGTRNTPRNSIPDDNTTMPEGAVIYMVGGGSWYPLSNDRVNWTFEGTAENPCWLLGSGAPTITRPQNDDRCSVITSGTHYIARDIRLEIESSENQVQFIIGAIIGGTPSQYVCFENIYATNNAATAANGIGCIAINGSSSERTQFVVVYNCTVYEMGAYAVNPNQLDSHCVRPIYFSDYIWIIDCNLSRSGADSIQCGNSNNSNPNPADVCHYIWIAGCTMTENFENSLDTKNCYHVVLAKNDIYNFHNANFGANNTAILINNEEGPFASYKWINANRVWDFGGPGVRDSGDHDGELNYIFNNLFYDSDGVGASKSNGGIDTQSWVCHNTFYNITGDVIDGNQGGSNVEHRVRKNIFHSCGDAESGSFDVREFADNIWFNCGTIEASFTTVSGTITDDPLLNEPDTVDRSVADMRLQSSSSPAYQAATQESFWDDFETYYGMNIRYDFGGTARAASGGGNHSIGAYEETVS